MPNDCRGAPASRSCYPVALDARIDRAHGLQLSSRSRPCSATPATACSRSARPRTSCRRRRTSGCLPAGVDRSAIRDLRQAWLTTVVSRLALDTLTSARARRERYVGPWLPEPIVDTGELGEDPPAASTSTSRWHGAAGCARVALAGERSAFLLHDCSADSFLEVADVVGRDGAGDPPAGEPGAARGGGSPAALPGSVISARVSQRVPAAAEEGDLASLLELLDPDVTLRSDGGGVVSAAREGDQRRRATWPGHHPDAGALWGRVPDRR